MSNEINATDCSDGEILKFIQEVRGEDNKHYQADWIVLRALKILIRDYRYSREGFDKSGTLTEEEQKDITELASTGRLE